MNFEAAMNAVQEGKKVTHPALGASHVFLSTPEGEGEAYIAKFSEEVGETPYTPTEADQEATDWSEVAATAAVA